MDDKVSALSRGMAKGYDDIVCQALNLTADEITAMDLGRISILENPDKTQVVVFDGRPIVRFWPIETKTVSDGNSIKLVCSQNYQILRHYSKEG